MVASLALLVASLVLMVASLALLDASLALTDASVALMVASLALMVASFALTVASLALTVALWRPWSSLATEVSFDIHQAPPRRPVGKLICGTTGFPKNKLCGTIDTHLSKLDRDLSIDRNLPIAN